MKKNQVFAAGTEKARPVRYSDGCPQFQNVSAGVSGGCIKKTTRLPRGFVIKRLRQQENFRVLRTVLTCFSMGIKKDINMVALDAASPVFCSIDRTVY